MAVVYRGPHRGIKLTDNDVLWLARAFVGEAGSHLDREEASALFWCWMDRLMLVNAKWSQEGWGFSRFIRAHSQPINPLWLDPHGEKCQKHPEACTPAKLKRRRGIQSLMPDDLRAMGAWDLAVEAQEGGLERVIPEPIYDFASCSLTSKQNRPSPGVNIGGNCFLTYVSLTDKEKARVLEGDVEISGSATDQISKGAAALLALPVGYVLYRIAEKLYDKYFRE